MREIKFIVVHCTATPQNTKVSSIQNYWRTEKGWKSPGYHYMIDPGGSIVQLAHEDAVTNGVKGFNSHAVHLSYIGGIDRAGKPIDNRTAAQKKAIRKLLRQLRERYPNALVQGHRDFPGVTKACPSFDAIMEYADI